MDHRIESKCMFDHTYKLLLYAAYLAVIPFALVFKRFFVGNIRRPSS